MKQLIIADNYNGALQNPIQSRFSYRTTAAEVINGIDLTGKTAIITGGYAGIGLETTKLLANAGAEVWVPARDIAKAENNLAYVPNVTVVPMDLANPASIHRPFCQTIFANPHAPAPAHQQCRYYVGAIKKR
jgi:hypothetical protein